MPVRPQLLKLQEIGKELESVEHRRQKVLVFMREAPFMCFMKDAETGRYQFMNKAGCALVGMEEQEIVGKTDWELFSEDLAKRMIGHDLKVLRSRSSIIAIETRAYSEARSGAYLISKFLVTNGQESIGGIAFELPDTFTVEGISDASKG